MSEEEGAWPFSYDIPDWVILLSCAGGGAALLQFMPILAVIATSSANLGELILTLAGVCLIVVSIGSILTLAMIVGISMIYVDMRTACREIIRLLRWLHRPISHD